MRLMTVLVILFAVGGLLAQSPGSPKPLTKEDIRQLLENDVPSERLADLVGRDGIHNEAIVDAYGPEEQALGWYYYLENKIRFPFHARCIRAKAVSPLLKGEEVEARRLAPEDARTADVLVQIHWHGRKMAVPLSQLTGMDVDESTAEAIADWQYWVAQGYCFCTTQLRRSTQLKAHGSTATLPTASVP